MESAKPVITFAPELTKAIRNPKKASHLSNFTRLASYDIESTITS